jgi:hypothetical protein
MEVQTAPPAAQTPVLDDAPPSTWSNEAARASVLVAYQGRRKTWLHQKLGISRVYLYRIMLKPGEPQHSATPPGFWQQVAGYLHVHPNYITRGLPPDAPELEWATAGLGPEAARALRARLVER